MRFAFRLTENLFTAAAAQRNTKFSNPEETIRKKQSRRNNSENNPEGDIMASVQAETKAEHLPCRKSFVRTIELLLVLYLVLLLVILGLILSNARSTMQQGAARTLEQTVSSEIRNLDQILESNETALASLLHSAADIQGLASADATKRSVSSQNVLQDLKAVMTENTRYLLVYDCTQEIYLEQYSAGLTYSDREAIRDSVTQLAESAEGSAASRWFHQTVNGKGYLVRLYVNSWRVLGAYIPDSYIQKSIIQAEGISTAFTEGGDTVCWLSDEDSGDTVSSETSPDVYLSVPTGEPVWILNHSRYCYGSASEKGNFTLYGSMSAAKVLGSWESQQVLVLALILLAILFLAGIIIYLRRCVMKPMRDVLEAMKKIENGETDRRLPEKAATSEFASVNHSFNQMMDTIVNLRMKSYEERIQFDEATLKYVQLQIRPHFFLNALTTIHSMTYQNRNEDIRTYIELLSKNIRYLFRAGLHTVPLSEEIDHVRDYMAMQEMLYPGCVFEFIDIDDSAAGYQVPQLIVHTMLENIYKHAVSSDRLTSVLISAREEDHGGEKMCHITVEDDGKGYPQEFLDQIRRGEVKVRPDGHGVGLWNVKKTLSLMYRREDLIEFSNKEPQGSRADIWVPRRAKRQSSVWKL